MLARPAADVFEDRLLTLTGAGGIGKTRLALRAARQAQAAFPDGVWVTELSPLHDPGLVGLAVMETLGLADQSTKDVVPTIADWLSGRRLLLVLDSCEHVLPGCVAMLRELLADAPGLRVMATSRQPLGVGGEQRIDVDPLPVTGEHAVAARLFAERAAAATPGFRLDARNKTAVRAICRRLDGVPLAIELAAAQLTDLSVEVLRERLGERLPSRLDLLTSPGDRTPPRHQALRTTIGWSHELCEPLERLLWARLSVFAGSFDLEGAEQVCTGGPLPRQRIVTLLAQLIDKSVVRRDERDWNRFRMLDTVREYGADWLRALGEERRLRLRHRDFYRDLARRACTEWNTGSQVLWCERVVAEHSNMRAAVDFALAEPDPPAAFDIAAYTGFLWRHCGYLRDARAILEPVLTVDGEPGPVRTLALWSLAATVILQGDREAAALWVGLCVQAAAEEGDPTVIDAAKYVEAGELAVSGRLERAVEVFMSGQRLPVRSDWCGAAMLQRRAALGFAYLMMGEHERVLAVCEQVLPDCERTGEHWVSAYVKGFLAQSALALGDAVEAERRAREAAAGHRVMHNVHGVAMALDTLAGSLLVQGAAEQAALLLAVTHRIWQLTGKAQMNSPQLKALRRALEDDARAALGDGAYEAAYREGLGMSYEEALAYVATTR
ncbi:ATP-binding protein [Streptomyces sp. NPDC059009]|uniref:ATP-binding protein n=1 Tax=Streptomyces sp. NPDC059009 TaxID=3346694 RepID=UPI0036AAC7BB